jgi:hypothetical protein
MPVPAASPARDVALKRTFASRCHHPLKTLWGWQDKQLPDGTVTLAGYASENAT